MKAYRWGHSAVVLAVGLFLAACGGKDEITVEPEPTPPPGPVEPVESDEQLLLQLSAGALDGARRACVSIPPRATAICSG